MALANITNNILTDSGILVTNLTPTTRTLTINGTTYDLSADRSWTIATGVGGSGTTNYLPKFTGASTIGNSLVQDSGSAITITGSNYLFNLSGGGTSRIAASINNTSGNLEFGLEGSAGNQLFTGMAAYQAGIGTSNNTSLNFATNTVVRMQLNTSGNLGLGVTPSAWGSGYTAFQIENNGIMADGDRIWFYANGYFDGSSNRYLQNGFASRYYQANSSHVWETAPSGTAGNAISFTQAMTLDASGRLGIGTTSPSYKLQVNGASGTIARITDGTNNLDFYAGSSLNEIAATTSLLLSTNGATRLTIASTGAATFSSSVSTGSYMLINGVSAGTSTYLQFNNNGTAIGYVGSSAAINSGASTSVTLGVASGAGLTIASTGAATFSSSVTATSGKFASANGTTYAATPQLRIDGNGVNNSYAQITFTDSALSDGKISYFPAAAAENRYFSISPRQVESDFVIRGSNVGIGTATPTSLFHAQTSGLLRGRFYSTANASFLDIENASSSFYIGTDDASGTQFGVGAYSSVVWRSGAYPIIFATNNTERMRITSGGVVGINTTSPTSGATLAVNGNIVVQNSNNSVFFGTAAVGYGDSGAIGRASTNGYHIQNSIAGDLCIGAEYNSAIRFGTGTSGTLVQSMGILANGNVGINTASPSYKLDVSGTGRFTSDVIVKTLEITNVGTDATSSGLSTYMRITVNGQNYLIPLHGTP